MPGEERVQTMTERPRRRRSARIRQQAEATPIMHNTAYQRLLVDRQSKKAAVHFL